MVREAARPHRRRRARRPAPGARHLSPGLAAPTRVTPTGASIRLAGGRSRAFADIGSHWFDLVEFVTGERCHGTWRRSSRPDRSRRQSQRGRRRRSSSRPTGGALGSVVVSQVSAGRKNALMVECSGARGARSVRPGGTRVALARTPRPAAIVLARDPATLAPDAARHVVAPAGHPQGYLDCIDRLRRRRATPRSHGTPPEGLPTFADGLRSVHLVELALRSAAGSAGGALGRGRLDEARVPHRVPAR